MNDLNRGIWFCTHRENIKKDSNKSYENLSFTGHHNKIYKIVRNWCQLHLCRMFTVAADSALNCTVQIVINSNCWFTINFKISCES